MAAKGYLPETTKSILVVSLSNVSRTEEFFQWMGLRIVTGSRRLGGFIRDGAAEKIWMVKKFERFAEFVGTLEGVSHNHPQFAYAVL